ncbi:MAG: glycosyltransferase [bacterium]
MSRDADLTILAAKKSDFSSSASNRTHIINASINGKAGLILFSFFWLLVPGKKKKYDMVITEPSIIGVCGFWAKVVCRMKWVVDIWDIPIRCHSKSALLRIKAWLTRKIFKRLYQFADLFIVSILPDFELKEFDLPPEKMLILKNAIWLDGEKPARWTCSNQNSFNILCMRSLHTSDMGLDILSAAFLALQEKLQRISLTIIGIIPEDIKYQVAGLEGLKNVEFHEFVEHDRLLEMIQAASVCVIPFKNVPDLSQTYPVKVLEYFSLGKAIIASDIAGISHMIRNGDNGLLFRAGDYQDLAEKIQQLFHNRTLMDALSKHALESRSEFDCVTKNEVILHKLQHMLS